MVKLLICKSGTVATCYKIIIVRHSRILSAPEAFITGSGFHGSHQLALPHAIVSSKSDDAMLLRLVVCHLLHLTHEYFHLFFPTFKVQNVMEYFLQHVTYQLEFQLPNHGGHVDNTSLNDPVCM